MAGGVSGSAGGRLVGALQVGLTSMRLTQSQHHASIPTHPSITHQHAQCLVQRSRGRTGWGRPPCRQ